MKRILYIILSISILLTCTNAFAGEDDLYLPETLKYTANGEFRADWESGENARILGESVLRSFRNGDVSGFKLNALCSYEAMEETGRIRGLYKSLIESEKRSGGITEQSSLAAEILVRAAEYDITGLTENEKSLVKSAKNSPFSGAAERPGNLAGSGFPSEEIALSVPAAAVNSSCKKINFKPGACKGHRGCSISSITPGIDFETVHADYYRLFLYMRDDAGDSFSLKNTYSISPSYTQLTSSFFSAIQIRKLQKTDSGNIEIQPLLLTGCISCRHFCLMSAPAGIADCRISRLHKTAYHQKNHISANSHNHHGGLS